MRKMLAGVVIVVAGLVMLSAPNVMGGPLEGVPCNGDFNNDGNVDADDVTEFLVHFGRNQFNDPCPPTPEAPVPKTGQTTCYDETGVSRPCTGTGEDGEHQKGVAWPNPRFTDNGDGTVTDNMTGLIWLKNANCFGFNRSWSDALSDSNGLADGSCELTDGSNAGDWRLPNRFELESLLNLEYYSPVLSNTAGTGKWSEGDPFTNVQSNLYYWSSTTQTVHTEEAHFIGMISGFVGSSNKTSNGYVWPVRGGQ